MSIQWLQDDWYYQHMTRVAVFTDLDGTLLEHHTYEWKAASAAFEELERAGAPCVFVTSKTRAEVEYWRTIIGNIHPFIVENGAAAFFPLTYFPGKIPDSVQRGEYHVIEWGAPYSQLIGALADASRAANCRVIGFSAMTASEIAEDSGLSLEQAALAKQREYDEPFRVIDSSRTAELFREIERRGLRWTQGGRYFHIIGDNDKAVAVGAVADLYRQRFGEITTIGLGDGPNDLEFLEGVDRPVIVRSKSVELLASRLPHAIVTEHPGPTGWNEAILRLLAQVSSRAEHDG